MLPPPLVNSTGRMIGELHDAIVNRNYRWCTRERDCDLGFFRFFRLKIDVLYTRKANSESAIATITNDGTNPSPMVCTASPTEKLHTTDTNKRAQSTQTSSGLRLIDFTISA